MNRKAINAMMYHRGAPSDFDEWEKLGAKGWGYRDLAGLPLIVPPRVATTLTQYLYRFFRSSENFTPNALYPGLKPEEHGDSGPWKTSYAYCSDICKQSLVALEEVRTSHSIRHNCLI